MVSEATFAGLAGRYNNRATALPTVWSPLKSRTLLYESVTLTPAILLSSRLQKEQKIDVQTKPITRVSEGPQMGYVHMAQ